MAPKIVDKDEKRMQLAHAAAVVFGEKGFDRTRMVDVAKAAGVGKGTLYEYFADKKDLFIGSMDVLMEGMLELMQADLDPNWSTMETMRAISEGTVAAMEHMGHTYRFFLEYMLYASRTGGDYNKFSDVLKGYRSLVSGILRQGIQKGEIDASVDPDRAAAAYAAWFDGAIFHWIVLPETLSIGEMADEFLTMLERGWLPVKKGGKK